MATAGRAAPGAVELRLGARVPATSVFNELFIWIRFRTRGGTQPGGGLRKEGQRRLLFIYFHRRKRFGKLPRRSRLFGEALALNFRTAIAAVQYLNIDFI
jgi:hypothetical protein